MDTKDIKRIVKLMVENDLSEVDIVDGETKIHLKRGGEVHVIASPVGSVAAPAPAAAPVEAQTQEAAPDDGLIEIRSPMVGTFYTSPSPDSDNFTEVGSIIGPNDTVCIVEAMKVMNEIASECRGTVAEICVENAQPVEFGQVLFRVKPSS